MAQILERKMLDIRRLELREGSRFIFFGAPHHDNLVKPKSYQTSEVPLRRAHHVPTFAIHFYIHNLPHRDPSTDRDPVVKGIDNVLGCGDLGLDNLKR